METEPPATPGAEPPTASFDATGRVVTVNDTFVERFGDVRTLDELRDLDQRRMRAVLSNIADTVTLVDADGTVLYTTGFHSDVLGYDPAGWRGRSIVELSHPEDLDDMLLLRHRVLDAPGREFRTEVRVRDATGTFQYVDLTAINLLDDPDVRGIVLTTRNVTNRRELEEQLAQRRDEALEEARVRSEFVARVSHELRNQVHALHGLTELLGRSDVPASVRELAAAAQRQAEQFEFLVNDLLEYSRLNATGRITELQPCTVRQVVADIRSTLLRLARTGVAVEVAVDDDVPAVVETDESRLRQVLLNLVGNAAKFTHDGSITIRVRRWSDVELAVEVRDTGVGIAQADLERIFTPFEHAGSAGAHRGAGLGLSISQRAIELLGGWIDVRSELGRGSTFTVVVPATALDDDAAAERPTVQTATPVDASVLVVEDNPVNQQLVAEQLRRIGARPTVVGSGEEALEVLERAGAERFDCVLMDWQLPDMDGLETTRRIRATPTLDALPVVGMTASALPDDRDACLQAGMSDLLVKPVGLGDLSRVLLPYSAGTGASTDLAALDQLVDDLGALAPVRSIVSTYLVELDRRHEDIVSGVLDGDVDRVRRTAHTLRSTSRTLGARAVDELSTQLEAEPFPPDPELVERFSGAVAATRDSLAGWLEDHPA